MIQAEYDKCPKRKSTSSLAEKEVYGTKNSSMDRVAFEMDLKKTVKKKKAA